MRLRRSRRLYGQRQWLFGETRLPKAIGELGGLLALFVISGVPFSPRNAMTCRAILALPPFISLPADVPRTAAGMFTISYTCAIIIPTICGALWDLTGKPWTAFVPLCLCAVALAVLGTVVTRRSPAVQAAQG